MRQGCPLSPTLFNIHMNEVMVEWKQIFTKGITLSNSTKINTVLLADDQGILGDSEDN